MKEIYAMACVVINSRNQILLLKRSPNKKFFPGEWSVVGAAPLSKDEDMESIAKREIKDELGQDGDIIRAGEKVTFRNQGFQWHIFPFLAQLNSDEITLNEEHTEYKWVNKEGLKNYKLNPLVLRTLNRLLSSQS